MWFRRISGVLVLAFGLALSGILPTGAGTAQAQNSSEINTAAAFILAIFPVIQVVTKVPISVAIATDTPETSNAIINESNCM